MSLLDTRTHATGVERAQARAGEATGVVMAGLTGVWTAAISWLCVALPVLLAWAASAQTTAGWGQAARVATQAWLLLHRVATSVPGGRVGVLPIGLALVPLALCWLAGRRLGHGLQGLPVGALGTPLLAMSVGYALPVAVAGLAARGDGTAPVAWQAVLGGLAVPLVAGVPAALRATGRPVLPALADAVRLPPVVRRTARAGALAAAAVLLVAALLVTVALVGGHDRVLLLQRALDAGPVGGAVLTLGQVAFVPDLVGWAVAMVAGPGFAVGVGTSVTAGGSSLGLLPLVPVLGAVPPSGAVPSVLLALPLVPVLAGAAAGVLSGRGAAERGVVAAVTDGLVAACVGAVLLSVLVLLSAGPAGPGALAHVGPSLWRTGLVLLGELAAGAAAAAWITHRRVRG